MNSSSNIHTISPIDIGPLGEIKEQSSPLQIASQQDDTIQFNVVIHNSEHNMYRSRLAFNQYSDTVGSYNSKSMKIVN